MQEVRKKFYKLQNKTILRWKLVYLIYRFLNLHNFLIDVSWKLYYLTNTLSFKINISKGFNSKGLLHTAIFSKYTELL